MNEQNVKASVQLIKATEKILPKVKREVSNLDKIVKEAKQGQIDSSLKQFYQRVKDDKEFNASLVERILIAFYSKLFSVIFKQDPYDAPVAKHMILCLALLASTKLLDFALSSKEVEYAKVVMSDKDLLKLKFADQTINTVIRNLRSQIASDTFSMLIVLMISCVIPYFHIIQRMSRKQFMVFITTLAIIDLLKMYTKSKSLYINRAVSYAISIIGLSWFKPFVDKALNYLSKKDAKYIRQGLLLLLVLAYIVKYISYVKNYVNAKAEYEKYYKEIENVYKNFYKQALLYKLQVVAMIHQLPPDAEKELEKKYGKLQVEIPQLRLSDEIRYSTIGQKVLSLFMKKHNLKPKKSTGSIPLDFKFAILKKAEKDAEKIVKELKKKYNK